ncbi:unnamed protein product [Blepharisma stoltei]|uniref:YeeE/YedE family protein n=1 Tax=Blepharisma stoltei TaxID=1481888 RepID=A0AAU9IWV7_9CILI|nr:unnamed protein product [Blepharisma stoltei]
MLIDWNTDAVILALLGGSLISLATILNLLFMGRVTGISGMVFTVVKLNTREGLFWKISFLLGLVSAVLFFKNFVGDAIWNIKIFDGKEAELGITMNEWIIGSLLVGIGTQWGNGCTSGHAVCGIPRLSPRSIIATLIFMFFGVVTATLKQNKPFQREEFILEPKMFEIIVKVSQLIFITLYGVYFFAVFIYSISSRPIKNKFEPVFSFIIGNVFGSGLVLAGMCRRTKILGFLALKDGWDPSLLFVMGAAVGINLIAFNIVLREPKPLMIEKWSVPTRKDIDVGVIVGPALFGVGWGITGMCPGPAVTNLVLLPQAILMVIFIGIGQVTIRAILDAYPPAADKVHKG